MKNKSGIKFSSISDISYINKKKMVLSLSFTDSISIIVSDGLNVLRIHLLKYLSLELSHI